MIFGETPAVGSSRSITVGRVIMALPNAACCRCPPDRVPTTCFCLSLRIGKRSYTSSSVLEMSSVLR